MIRTFIAYDENDYALGEYFEDSHKNIVDDISAIQTVTNISISGLNCTEANINATIAGVQGENFIFVVLSHGNDNECVSHAVYVSNSNAHFFSNSFFYSTACSTGKNLAKILIGNGCHSFIGYDQNIDVLLDYSTVFYSCENFGIKTFLSNDETIEVSYNKMIDYYNEEIDRLIAGSMDDLIAASYLSSNKNCLVLAGNTTLTRNDFN